MLCLEQLAVAVALFYLPFLANKGLKQGRNAVETIKNWSFSWGARLVAKANLKLRLPFFANELLGAIHLHGPLGLAP